MQSNIEIVKNIRLKSQNSDFRVAEIPLVFNYKDSGKYAIYSLLKSGITTTCALELISNKINYASSLIKYSGLKDEDGITTQFISLPNKLDAKHLSQLNDLQDIIQLTYVGNSDKELEIGSLLGNAFNIVARNIPNELAIKLSKLSVYRSIYINYYGIQRFGIPGYKKTSHNIGRYLLDNDYENALELLKEQDLNLANISASVLEPKKFFAEMDPRRHAFYLSSYYSYEWNNILNNKIQQIYPDHCQIDIENIPFTYTKGIPKRFEFFVNHSEQELIRYRVKDNKLIGISGTRSALIPLEIRITNVREDLIFKGNKCVDLDFMLQSGSYATVVVPQFFYEILSL